MENHGVIQEVIAWMLLAVLVLQFLLYRWLRKSRDQAVQIAADAMTNIVKSLNMVTRSISVTLSAAGIAVVEEGAPGASAPIPGSKQPTSEEEAAARAARKAELWRQARSRK